jgi:hypothetical protein
VCRAAVALSFLRLAFVRMLQLPWLLRSALKFDPAQRREDLYFRRSQSEIDLRL